MDYQTYIAQQIAQQIKRRPIEARIVRKVVRALKAAGTPVVKTWDGFEWVEVRTEREVLETVFNLDEVRLYTADDGWVYLVMGQDWDTLCDWTMDLDEALMPVNDYIMKYGE